MTLPDDLIRGNAEAARAIGRDPRTIRTWVARGLVAKYPDPQNPRGVAYSRAELLAAKARLVDVEPSGSERADISARTPAVPIDLAPLAALIERQAETIARLSAELAALRAEPPALSRPPRPWWRRLAGG